jgi:hypothetical protein
MRRLFEQSNAMLRHAGCIAMSGQIVDASLVAAPRQRNTDDEKNVQPRPRQRTVLVLVSRSSRYPAYA